MASSPARRLLQTNSGQYQTLPAAEAPSPLSVDSDVVVILAALLCALICVVGLAAVARCARSRSRAGAAAAPSAAAAAAQARGLKKKALRALPSLAYEDAVAAAGGEANAKVVLAECAICLSEFAAREVVRVLPQCGHAFHVACIDTWLAAHSSCPSCRRVLVVGEDAGKRPRPQPPQPMRCRKCDAAVDEEAAASSSGSGGDTAADS